MRTLGTIENTFGLADLDLTVIDGLESVRQRVHQRLRYWSGTWVLNATGGVPYLPRVLGHQIEDPLAERAITSAIENVDDVDSVTDVVFTRDNETRGSTYDAIVHTRFGSFGISEGLPDRPKIIFIEDRIQPSVPEAPAALTATVLGRNRVRLTWTRPVSESPPLLRTEYRIDGGIWQVVPNSGAGGVLQVDIGSLTAGRRYVFEVRGVNSLGAGAVSPTADATPALGLGDFPIAGRTYEFRALIEIG